MKATADCSNTSNVSPLPRRGAGGEGEAGSQIIKRFTSIFDVDTCWQFIPLLLLLTITAPACAPDKPPQEVPETRTKNLVLLTDTTQWNAAQLTAYRDSLTNANYRVLISGYPGETLVELTARIPWLLQPGVDLFIYDPRLAGPDGADSIRRFLDYKNLPTRVVTLRN